MTRRFRSAPAPPYDRGVEFGAAHARQVTATVAAYQRLFDTAAGRSVDLAHWGALALESITGFAPELAEEISGIASGATLSVTAVAAINARTEILAAVGRGTVLPHECSTVVQLRRSAAPLSIQAWDWYAELDDLWLVWEIPHTDGRRTTTVTEYGIVGKIGVNDRGLGNHFNILHHRDDGLSDTTIGVPVHVVARAVLDDADDLNQALTRAAQAPVSASTTLTYVAAAGTESAAVSIELTPAGVGYALPDPNGLLIHTNHFLTSPACLGDTELRNGPDTILRYDMLRRALAGRADTSVADVLEAMSSHLLGGGATCCHVDPTLAPSAQFQTLATVALDVAAGELAVHAGGACTAPAAFATPPSKEKLNAHA
ncbi:MAG: putative acyltransferase [Mycobacterium sp.]|jgi:isopenicillin-N N-acyltransferase-like protein|nr:putative acyltransferase [Mycobacterium sp.]